MAPACPNCGAAVPEEAAYCPSCGTGITAAAEPTAGSERTLAAIAHLLGLVTWIFGPLVVLIVTEEAFVEENAKNALIWQLMLTLYMLVSAILVLVVVGLLFLLVLGVLDLAFCIIAAIKASEGKAWQYPLTPNV